MQDALEPPAAECCGTLNLPTATTLPITVSAALKLSVPIRNAYSARHPVGLLSPLGRRTGGGKLSSDRLISTVCRSFRLKQFKTIRIDKR